MLAEVELVRRGGAHGGAPLQALHVHLVRVLLLHDLRQRRGPVGHLVLPRAGERGERAVVCGSRVSTTCVGRAVEERAGGVSALRAGRLSNRPCSFHIIVFIGKIDVVQSLPPWRAGRSAARAAGHACARTGSMRSCCGHAKKRFDAYATSAGEDVGDVRRPAALPGRHRCCCRPGEFIASCVRARASAGVSLADESLRCALASSEARLQLSLNKQFCEHCFCDLF